jgi:ESCRT-II complex subunit VPS36
MWLDAASTTTPSGRRSCCLALEAVASARRRSQLAFSLAQKVRVEVRVYADASRRPVPAAAARVASMSALMLRCRGPAPDAFAAALEAAAAAAARRPGAAVASHALPPGALPLNPATDSLASGSFSALPGAPGDQLRMAQQLYQQEQQQRQRQQQSAATATAIGPVVLPPPSSFAREPDAAMLRGIVEMGFSRAQGRRALLATGNEGVQQALDWILAFGDGGDGEEGEDGGVAPMADSPPPPPNAAAAAAAPASASFPSAGAYAYAPPAVYRPGNDGSGGFANPLSAGLPSTARPQPPLPPPTTTTLPPPSSVVGVSGILQRQQARTAATGQSMETAFRDLNALMAAAQEMVALAERFRAAEGDGVAAGAAGAAAGTTAAPVGASSTSEPLMIDRETQLQLIALGIASPVTRESAGARFTLELARQLADFVLSPVPAEGRRGGDDAAAGGTAASSDGLLARAGGVMLLHDVYCLFNRARGVELVSPEDLIAACEAFGRADGGGEGGGGGAASSAAAEAAAATSLGLPIRLRRLPSGVLVLQSTAFSDEELCRRIQELVDYDQEEAEEEEQGGVEAGEEDEEEEQQQRRQRGGRRPTTKVKVRPGALGTALFEADAARALRLPLALAREALRVAEQRGVLCRDEGGAEGLAFYRNFFLEC